MVAGVLGVTGSGVPIPAVEELRQERGPVTAQPQLMVVKTVKEMILNCNHVTLNNVSKLVIKVVYNISIF